MKHQPIGVVIIVLNKAKTHILLGKRKNAYKAGFYGLPGGRVESGEPLILSCKRELKEEAGIESDAFEYLGVIREKQETSDFIHFAYLCTDYTGDITNLEPDKCEEWIWFPLTQLPQNILPGHRKAVALYKKFQNNKQPGLSELLK